MIINKKFFKNKIGYVDNRYLGFKSNSKGHYVYINKINNDNTCNVNTIKSLEDRDGNFKYNKLKHVKNGYVYPIPVKDSNFKLWSGVNLQTIKNVNINNIKNIGCKSFKKRHMFLIGKSKK